ncbi:MAG: hypothetical protein AAF327_13865 [Cyanobacteria bacterium P01_A01_bin.37]
MPIKGLTDNGASFPCIGKIRKGAPKENNRMGKDLEYFRFDSQDRSAIASFQRTYGEEPKEINVLFPYEGVDENFFTCKEEWAAGGLVHRCDGEVCSTIRLESGAIQRHFAAPVPCPGGCKEIGRMKVIVQGLNRFAYVTVETHSINDIVNLHQQLSAAYMTFGQLNKMPFTIRRRPEQISTPGKDGKRVRREKWMLSVEVDSSWANKQLAATRYAFEQRAGIYQGELQGVNEPLALPQAKTIPVMEDASAFQSSETWQKFLAAIARADSEEAIANLDGLARQRVREGVLKPPNAVHDAIDQELAIARNRLKGTTKPLNQEVEENSRAVEVQTQFDLAQQLGWTDEKIGAIALHLFGNGNRDELTTHQLRELTQHMGEELTSFRDVEVVA